MINSEINEIGKIFETEWGHRPLKKIIKIGMHIIVVIALLGFIATAKDTLGLISGKEIENQLAAYSKAITCILSLVFVVFSMVSFIKARKANQNGSI